MNDDVDDGDQFRRRLERGGLAPLAELHEHRLMRVVSSAFFDAGEVQVEYTTVSEKDDVVMSECKDDAETPLHAEFVVVPYFRRVGER